MEQISHHFLKSAETEKTSQTKQIIFPPGGFSPAGNSRTLGCKMQVAESVNGSLKVLKVLSKSVIKVSNRTALKIVPEMSYSDDPNMSWR